MSIIPLALARASQGKGAGKGSGDDVLSLLALPIVAPMIGVSILAENIADKTKLTYQALKEKHLARAQQKAGKKEMEELKLTYHKLSEGKIGQVETEVSEDGKVKSTIIHTKYGPFIRTETNDHNAKMAKNEDLRESSVVYSGFVVALDEKGKKVLTYLDNAGQGVSKSYRINDMHDEACSVYTSGTVLAENGKKDSLNTWHRVETNTYECFKRDIPQSETFKFVASLEEKFQELLQQAQKQAEDNMQV